MEEMMEVEDDSQERRQLPLQFNDTNSMSSDDEVDDIASISSRLSRAPMRLRDGDTRMDEALGLLESLQYLDVDDHEHFQLAKQILQVLCAHWSSDDEWDEGVFSSSSINEPKIHSSSTTPTNNTTKKNAKKSSIGGGLTPHLIELLQVSDPPLQRLLIESMSQLAGRNRREVNLVVEGYKKILSTPSLRSFLVPIVASLSELSLSFTLKQEVLGLTQVALGLVEENDIPAITKALLKSITPSTAYQVIRAIRKAAQSVSFGVEALIMDAVESSMRQDSSIVKAFAVSWGFQPVMNGVGQRKTKNSFSSIQSSSSSSSSSSIQSSSSSSIQSSSSFSSSSRQASSKTTPSSRKRKRRSSTTLKSKANGGEADGWSRQGLSCGAILDWTPLPSSLSSNNKNYNNKSTNRNTTNRNSTNINQFVANEKDPLDRLDICALLFLSSWRRTQPLAEAVFKRTA